MKGLEKRSTETWTGRLLALDRRHGEDTSPRAAGETSREGLSGVSARHPDLFGWPLGLTLVSPWIRIHSIIKALCELCVISVLVS